MMPSLLRSWVGMSMVGITGAIPFTSFVGASAQKTTAQPQIPTTFSPEVIVPTPSTATDFSTALLTPTKQSSAKRYSKGARSSNKAPKSNRKPSTARPTDVPTAKTASIQQQIATPISMLIRVRILAHPNQLEIATSTSAEIIDTDGKGITGLRPDQPYLVEISPNGLQVGSQTIPNGMFINPGPDGLTFVDGHWYRGVMQLVYDGEHLLAINWVDLEQYLYATVGAEMPPSWDIEALKAQAIAARSYAVAHMNQPASPYFDLGNDERWQCYRGVETEADPTIAAVEETRGQVLTRDRQILTTQYAATDELSQTQGGIGFSMSQSGAQQLASQGASVEQILAYYYDHSELSIMQ